MSVTKNISKYIKDKGINLFELSKESGVSYVTLHASLEDESGKRELRANELAAICLVLRINPMRFFKDSIEQNKNMEDKRR